MSTAQDALGAELTALGYLDLFLRAGTEEQDRLWNRPHGPAALQTLAVDPGASWEPRFLAAEILFRKQANFPREAERAALADPYVEALRHAAIANAWGSPGELNGDAGRHLVSLGEPAAIALEALLDDARAVRYWGSREATWGNSFAFRVKDFAAFFISVIRGLPYQLHSEPSVRDKDIKNLGR